jgi:hypothetical protein
MSDLDRFANGITAPTPRIKCQDNGAPRPRYSDDEFLKIANAKGPNILKIVARDHK